MKDSLIPHQYFFVWKRLQHKNTVTFAVDWRSKSPVVSWKIIIWSVCYTTQLEHQMKWSVTQWYKIENFMVVLTGASPTRGVQSRTETKKRFGSVSENILRFGFVRFYQNDVRFGSVSVLEKMVRFSSRGSSEPIAYLYNILHFITIRENTGGRV